MLYQRGRARQLLTWPGGRADFDRAHAIAITEGDTLGLINVVGVKSFFAMLDGKFDESLRLNAERIPLAIAIGNRRSEGWGHALVAYLSLLREDLAIAHREYEAAIAAFRDAKRPPQELMSLIGLARVLEREGKIDQSKEVYRKALPLSREIGDKTQESDVWNNLANMEYEYGDLAVSEKYFRRAFDLKKAANAPDLAIIAGNVADINVLVGSYSAAESVLVDGLEHARRWGDATGFLNLKCDLGGVRIAQGRYAGATQCFRSALSIHGSIEDRVTAATGLAKALLAQDSVGAAIAVLDTHLVDLARVSPSSWRTNGFVMWARCLRAGGDVPRAGRAARAAWEDASARSDSTLGIVAATELGSCLREAGEIEAAHTWFQHARAMYVARAPRASAFYLREADRVSLAEPLLELSTVLLEAPRGATRPERERNLFDFVQQVKARTLLERVSDPRRALHIDPSFSRPATANEMQASTIHEGEVLIDCALAGDEVLLFAVTSQSLRVVRIEDAAVVAKQVSRYHRLLAQRPDDAAESGDVRAAARSLGLVFLGGIADQVAASSRVYVATDGWLAALPVETLVCPNDNDEPLVVRRDVVRVPSATLLRLQRGRIVRPYAGESASILAVASQASELQGARREITRLAARYRNVDRLRAEDRDAFIEAIARHDVVHVASHVRVDSERPWHSGILIAPASPHGDEPPGARRAGAEDLATVASASAVTSGDVTWDPYARAGQIASAHSDARLVVLSGCESALGRATQGEGVLGIAAAFFAAGSRSLVASIWEVDDRVTADLMERFYAELEAGKPVPAALRSAQLEIRSKRPHPFYWAGFIAIGDGDVTVRLARQPPGRRYLLILAGLTVVGVAAWVIMRGRGTIEA
jgi:CHAT domain-containing protein/Tfp pilus assembly protein PilF